MANLKVLRKRISSVKSTQKITKAMQLVAAAKLRKAKEQQEQATAYANKMFEIIGNLAENINSASKVSPLLKGSGKDNVHLLVVATSDRGLCGPFNSSIVKEAKSLIKKLKIEGKEVKIICIGKKGFEQLSVLYEADIIDTVLGVGKKSISYSDADDIAKMVIDRFNKEEFDVCTVIYNHFISAMAQTVTRKQIIPTELAVAKEIKPGEKGKDKEAMSAYEYEPDEDSLLTELIPKNISVQIYYMLLENAASEHGARMSAMDSATTSASKMIKNLTLLYNRTRQTVITTELIEVISGAEAV